MKYTRSLTIFASFFVTIINLTPINGNTSTKHIRGRWETNVRGRPQVGTVEKYEELFSRHEYDARNPQTVEYKPSIVLEERQKAAEKREQIEDSILSLEMIEMDANKVIEERLKGMEKRKAVDAATAASAAGAANDFIGKLPTASEILENDALMDSLMKLLIGCLVCFSGYQFFCDMLGVATGLLGGIFVYQIIADLDYEWVVWGQYVGAVVGGLICSILVKKVYMFAIFVIGAAGGVFGSHYMKDPLGLYEEYFPDDAEAVYYAAIVGLGLICGFLAMYAEKHIFIGATAFIGATFFTEGVEALAPDLTTEAYLIVTITLTVIGVFLQYKRIGFK